MTQLKLLKRLKIEKPFIIDTITNVGFYTILYGGFYSIYALFFGFDWNAIPIILMMSAIINTTTGRAYGKFLDYVRKKAGTIPEDDYEYTIDYSYEMCDTNGC